MRIIRYILLQKGLGTNYCGDEKVKEEKMLFYAHGGSGNHGCEALVRSSTKILNQKPILFSSSPDQDVKYGVSDFAELVSYYTSQYS